MTKRDKVKYAHNIKRRTEAELKDMLKAQSTKLSEPNLKASTKNAINERIELIGLELFNRIPTFNNELGR